MRSFPAILTLIFVIAKMLGYITWSWWIVFAPMWVGLAIALVIMLAGVTGLGLTTLLTARCFRKLWKK